MTIATLIASVTFAAFCVWLGAGLQSAGVVGEVDARSFALRPPPLCLGLLGGHLSTEA
jgi:hypothetical protein